MEVIKPNSWLLPVRIIQDSIRKGVEIDLRALARTEYKKCSDQHDRQLDRENDNDVTSEQMVNHSVSFDPVSWRRALIWIKRHRDWRWLMKSRGGGPDVLPHGFGGRATGVHGCRRAEGLFDGDRVAAELH
jgi:hypothetical protein